MASAAKSPKITAFFKPAAKEVAEKEAEKENSSIVSNSKEQESIQHTQIQHCIAMNKCEMTNDLDSMPLFRKLCLRFM